MQEDELKDAVLLVFANKQDLPNALSVSEIQERLQLKNTCRQVHIHIDISCLLLSQFKKFNSIYWCIWGWVGYNLMLSVKATNLHVSMKI